MAVLTLLIYCREVIWGDFLPVTVGVTPSLSGGHVFNHDRVNDTEQSLLVNA